MIKKLTAAAGGHEGLKGAAQMMMRSSSCWVTEPELEAAYQLIQLGGDGHSSSSKDGRSTISSSCTFDDDLVIMMVAPSDIEASAVESCGADMTAKCSAEELHDQDIASTSSPSSSSSVSSSCSAIKTGENFDVWEEIDASCLFTMKRKRKFRSIADLCANTKPNLVKKAPS